MPELLSLINAVLPKDAGSHLVARDIAYGPHEREKLDVYAPKAMTGELPVVFFIHGGGWESGDKSQYAFAGRALAALGYVAVLPNYRLAPSAHFPDFVDDCALALQWTSKNIGRRGGDASRIGLCGHSAGAYNAVMVALDPKIQSEVMPKCVAALSGPYDFYPFDVHASIQAFGGALDPLVTQPINLPLDGAPPMLLIHGTGDKTVHPKNSRTLAQKLKEAGREVELVEYDGASHFETLGAMMTLLRFRNPVLKDLQRYFSERLSVAAS